MGTNSVCGRCDYFEGCHKRISLDGVGHRYVKEIPNILPSCICIVQEICRDCELFLSKRCASWKVLNGKEMRGTLRTCAKKKPSRRNKDGG